MEKRRSKLTLQIGIVLAAIAAVLVGFQFVGSKESDPQLIQRALDESLQASREGRPGSALDLLSKSFEVNGMTILNRAEVAKYIQQQKPDIALASTVATIEGERAFIRTDVTLSTSGLIKFSGTIPNVELEFARESGTTLLIIPNKRWRLVKVTAPPESINAFAPNF